MKKVKKEKLESYFNKTETALKKVKNKIVNKEQGNKIIKMVKDYLSDARYFEDKKEYVNAFAALNYAHGWLDCGARLGIFNVKDDQLFTLDFKK